MTDAKNPAMLELLQDLMKKAKAAGATEADAVLADSTSVSVNRRMGKPESVTRSEEAEIGLRVLVGRRQAVVSSSDRSREALFAMAERAVSMARAVPEDPFAGIADPADLAKNFPDLDLYDATEIDVAKMNEQADRAEQAGLGIKGITNSDGAECGFGKETVYYAATNGFTGGYSSSGFSLSVSVIAGAGTGMETDYSYDNACYFSDMRAPEDIGREAGERAVRALKPRRVSTRQVPVVFDQRVSGGLIGSLAGAISGSAVARGTTFLKEKMGQKIFADGITVTDDPFLKRGARSRPFDAEGLAPQKRAIVDNGALTGWLLDLSSARQLGLKSTGNASRSSSSPPAPRCANFYMQPGAKTPEELISEIDEGFLVTRLMGSGANMVTGDYSRGAGGFWIEKGKIAYPVSEMTVAGNILQMWLNLAPANDLKHITGVDAPTTRVDGMTVAGA
jgi:PmbA protein